MIRTCDGTDENLKREQVNRVAASGTESMEWVPCDCGLVFDDVERLVVYPHHFIPSREDKETLLERVNQMVKEGKTSEEIRQALQLTPHLVGATVGASQQPTTKGSPMGDGFDAERTGRVSAEGTTDTEAPAEVDEETDANSSAEVDEETDVRKDDVSGSQGY